MKAAARKPRPPDFKVVIPARYHSRRLPGKPLRLLAGVPLIRRVYENAAASGAQEVIVATDDHRIAECVENFAGQAFLTGTAHASGTDRVAEVAAHRGWSDDVIVVNLQGDEPFLDARDVEKAAACLADCAEADCATLASTMAAPRAKEDVNKVKVVCDNAGFALYFSRSAIPAGEGTWLLHLGIYAYRRSGLRRFAALAPSTLERRERLEQLRLIESGGRIRVAVTDHGRCFGIDTEEDLRRADAFFARES